MKMLLLVVLFSTSAVFAAGIAEKSSDKRQANPNLALYNAVANLGLSPCDAFSKASCGVNLVALSCQIENDVDEAKAAKKSKLGYHCSYIATDPLDAKQGKLIRIEGRAAADLLGAIRQKKKDVVNCQSDAPDAPAEVLSCHTPRLDVKCSIAGVSGVEKYSCEVDRNFLFAFSASDAELSGYEGGPRVVHDRSLRKHSGPKKGDPGSVVCGEKAPCSAGEAAAPAN